MKCVYLVRPYERNQLLYNVVCGSVLMSSIDSDITLTTAHQEQLLDIVNTGEAKTFTIKSIKVTAQCDTIKVYCKH